MNHLPIPIKPKWFCCIIGLLRGRMKDVIFNLMLKDGSVSFMGFMDSYKRLEKLCGEVLNDDRRVSAYIDAMLNTSRGPYLVKGWEEDLKQLKHYRWMRNQISHNPECTEKNMCKPSDTQWVDNFHSRIMKQTDPLALYRKATQGKRVIAQKKTTTQSYQKPARRKNTEYNGAPTFLGFALTILLIFAMVAVLVWCIG